MEIFRNDPRMGKPIAPIPTDAWIDPLGKFYAVPECGHSWWASNYYGVFESTLEARGWVHVSFGTVMYDKTPRQAQIDTLYDLLMEYQNSRDKRTDNLRREYDRLMEVLNS